MLEELASLPGSIGDPRLGGLGIDVSDGVVGERLVRFLSCLKATEISMDVIRQWWLSIGRDIDELPGFIASLNTSGKIGITIDGNIAKLSYTEARPVTMSNDLMDEMEATFV
jgi:hypothetical protein